MAVCHSCDTPPTLPCRLAGTPCWLHRPSPSWVSPGTPASLTSPAPPPAPAETAAGPHTHGPASHGACPHSWASLVARALEVAGATSASPCGCRWPPCHCHVGCMPVHPHTPLYARAASTGSLATSRWPQSRLGSGSGAAWCLPSHSTQIYSSESWWGHTGGTRGRSPLTSCLRCGAAWAMPRSNAVQRILMNPELAPLPAATPAASTAGMGSRLLLAATPCRCRCRAAALPSAHCRRMPRRASPTRMQGVA
jgi:hypothetical protein